MSSAYCYCSVEAHYNITAGSVQSTNKYKSIGALNWLISEN